ncbi:MAG: proteasome assembly chaperone family protein [Archaeoglobi archaeon]|nr:proteasome assembly chaperone family protein [Candidatus Mnemosynella sp.]
MEPPSSQSPVFIEGFPGIGLVGVIACNHLLHELKMREIGFITSPLLPPVALIQEAVYTPSIRLYEDSRNGIVMVLSDVPVPLGITNELGKVIVDVCEKMAVRELITIAGLATGGEERRVFISFSSKELREKRKIDGVEEFFMGTISGIAGSTLMECYARGIPAISLLGETPSLNPDPKASAEVIKAMNRMYGWDISVDKLLEEAEKIEMQMQKLAEQVKERADRDRFMDYRMYG